MPGPGFRPPFGVDRLPLDLLRTQLVTRAPARVAEALMRWQTYAAAAPMPFYLPRRAVQQGWLLQQTRVGVQPPMQGPTQAMTALSNAVQAVLRSPAMPAGLETVPRGVPYQPVTGFRTTIPSAPPMPGPAMLTRRPVHRPTGPGRVDYPGVPQPTPAPRAFHQQDIGQRDYAAARRAAEAVARRAW